MQTLATNALAVSRMGQAMAMNDGNIALAMKQLGINSSIPRQTWERLADIIIAETQKSMPAVNDVRGRPQLLESVPIYVTVHTTPVESDLAPARQSMNPMVTPELIDLDYNHIGIPLPMVYEDTQIDMRTGGVPMPGGGTLSMRWGAVASQKIAEAHEKNLISGNSAIASADEQGNVRTIYGYTTHPQRNQVPPTAAWATFDVVNASFQAYYAALRNNFFYGPYMCYVGDTAWQILQNRNLGGSERTWRMLLLDSMELTDIKFSHDVAVDELVMVDLVPQTVTWVQSADVQASDWDAMGIFGTNIRMWSIASPHVKATYGGKSGVVHSTGIAAA